MKQFLNYVEIRTKITSLFTYALVTAVLLAHNVSLNVLNSVVFFLGMFTFDLTTTTINNYIDSKGNDQNLGFTRKTAKTILFALLGLSIIFGLWLVALTDIIVLLLGMFCFAVGILYTYGPIAISRQPYGEAISGVLYGYFIPFILVYINMGDKLLLVSFDTWITVQLNGPLFLKFLVLGIVPTFLTAAIMLGNNTCDVEADVAVKRFTLPYYIGQGNAVKLLRWLYIGVYAAIVAGVVSGVYHWLVLGMILTFPTVMKNVTAFSKELRKPVSFPFVIKNFVMVMASTLVLVIISIFL